MALSESTAAAVLVADARKLATGERAAALFAANSLFPVAGIAVNHVQFEGSFACCAVVYSLYAELLALCARRSSVSCGCVSPFAVLDCVFFTSLSVEKAAFFTIHR